VYNVRTTLLEKFRRFHVADDSNPWDNEQSLFETLAGTFAGNDKTRIGTAFHKLVELGRPEYTIHKQDDKGIVTIYHVAEGFAFTEEQARVAYSHREKHPYMISEVAIGKVYETPYGPFYVSGHTDGVDGVVIRDTKTKFSAVESQGYLDSYQWRIYLDILGLKQFYYDVFEVRSFPKEGIDAAREIEIDGEKKFIFFIDKLRFQAPIDISCFAYPDMKRDIYQLLCAFAEWIQDRRYWGFLKQCHADGTAITTAATGTEAGATKTQTAVAASTAALPT
jgi:hypothetical protein